MIKLWFINFVLSIASALLFLSCDVYDGLMDEWTDDELAERASGHDLIYMEEWEALTIPSAAFSWTTKNIKYVEEGADTWTSPGELVARGYGDCEDLALLAMNILYVIFGIEASIVLVQLPPEQMSQGGVKRGVVAGGDFNHAAVYYNGHVRLMDGRPIDLEIRYKFTFWEVFDRDSIPKEIVE